mgnify:CR=1 FL=1|tara:strand:- start:22 stop:507 length:486 start_codon:yes stop_codon:yes gene_type:complete
MLIINEDCFNSDKILKVHCGDNWNGEDSMIMMKCGLDQIKKCLEQCQNNNKKMLLVCDCTKGTFPPLPRAMQVVTFMHGIKPILKNSLEHTVIYVKNEQIKKWLDQILKVYKPVRPIHIVRNKQDIKKHLMNVQHIEMNDEEDEKNDEELAMELQNIQMSS